MDETLPQTPDNGLNKLDLSQLQSFSFGTSWVQEKPAPGGAPRGDRERRDDRPRREGDAPPRRDRRDFTRPAGNPGPSSVGGAPGAPAQAGAPAFAPRGDRPAGPGGPGRPEGGAPRGERPRFEGRGDPRGPRRDSRDGPGGQAGGRPDFRGPPREPVGPYISPFFGVTFYPEDQSFSALAQAIRKSCRTFELFYIAKSVVDKNDRYVAVVQRLDPNARPGEAAPAQPAAKPAPFFISVPDGVPFESEEAAINYVMEKHLGSFFDVSDVEIEAPKGNFQVINRCPVTGTLLAPPNYHRYLQILQQHHAANVRIPFDAYKARVESVREPELIAQWLEQMKKTTRYTVKSAASVAPSAVAAPDAAPAAEPSAESTPESVSAELAADAPSAPAAEAPVAAPDAIEPAAPVISFDSIEDARQYLLTTAREKIVRSVEQLRFPGRILETLPAGSEIRRAVEGSVERQRRFPLDTANALRGRLRRESFTIFKKGSKGISYVCAVKRRFRVAGQAFSDSLSALITFIETHPMVKESELPAKLLAIAPIPAPVEGAAPVEISAEDHAKLLKLKGDLRYLVKEGYVTEFVDGSLFTPAPMVESKKRQIEATDVDPDNFPDAPAPKVAEVAEPAAEAVSEPVEEPAAESVAESAAEAAPAAEAPEADKLETPPAA